MRRYTIGILIFAISVLVFGFMSEKITPESFQYISFPDLGAAVVKSLVVVVIFLLAAVASVPSLLIDLILRLFTDYDFVLLNHLWDICWKGVTLQWFWAETSGSSIFFGALILIVLSALILRKGGG